MLDAAVDGSLAIMPEAILSGKQRALRCLLCGAAYLAFVAAASADDCAPEPQGEGRVAGVIDARTIRLDDGRVIRLAGLAPLPADRSPGAAATLADIAIGRTVSLHGDSNAPDRYGRQHAWVFAEGQEASLQAALTTVGAGFRDIISMDAGCRSGLERSEQAAHAAGLGLWAAPAAVKNAERPDDFSTDLGHFVVVEGRVRSVRQSGGTTYVNFGRRWIEGFAVVVPARAVSAFEAAGLGLKGLQERQLRVRGYLMRRGGPRIEALRPDQIEVVGGDALAITRTRD